MTPLEAFLRQYPPERIRIQAANEGELRHLGASDGVLELSGAPANTETQGGPDDPSACHLWVIWPEGVPYILERAPLVQPPLQTGKAKHSNLTGGADASCGGELWVDPVDASKLYVNGASGRYGPRTAKQLEDAVALFRSRGFTVESFGWDELNGRAWRVFRR